MEIVKVLLLISAILFLNASSRQMFSTQQKHRSTTLNFTISSELATLPMKTCSLWCSTQDTKFRKFILPRSHRYGLRLDIRLRYSHALLCVLLSGDVCVNPGPTVNPNLGSANCNHSSPNLGLKPVEINIKARGLAIAHLNVRSLLGKLDEIKLAVTGNVKNFAILSISETWLNASISDAEIQIPGYTCVRKDRPGNKRGGGTLVYVRDGLPFKVRSDLNNDETECLWIEINRTKCKPVLIGCVYRAPDFELSMFISSLEKLSTQIDFMKCDVILLGDFNVDFSLSGKRNPLRRKLLDFMRSLDLTQLLSEPTRVTDTSRSMIDLIFVSHEHRFIDSGVIPLSISDHSLVYCVLKVGKPKVAPRTIEYRSFKCYDRDAFLEDLSNVPWHIIDGCETTDDSVLTWNKLFLDVADTHAPIRRRRVNGIRCPWMTSKLSEAMRDRDYHHRKAVKSGISYHWQMYRKLRNFVNAEIKRSKSNYYINLIEDSKGDSAKIWKTVNDISSRNNPSSSINCIVSDEVQYTDQRSIASVLNKHFASIGRLLANKLSAAIPIFKPTIPNTLKNNFQFQQVDESFVRSELKSLKTNKAIGLDKISARLLKDAVNVVSPSVTRLLNLSLTHHLFPSVWKCAKITALFKSGDRTDTTNYRPISILPTLSKLLEKAAHLQFYEYLDKNNLLTDKQFGFRPQRSTVSALTSFTDEILCNMEKGKLCGAVFLDLSKAFDTVNHVILLTKLSAIGVCDEDLKWFKSYLASRHLRTSCGPELSDPLTCNLGVPQGSILGPLLFVVYVNDLPSVVNHVQVTLYADDTVLYYFSAKVSDLEEKLNSDLKMVSNWLNENQLTLNAKKTKVMMFGSSRKLRNIASITITVFNCEVERVESFKYLGITFSSDLTWSEHIDKLSAKLNKRLGLLKRIRHLLPQFARLLFFNALISPLFDYADLVWGDKDNAMLMQSLQVLQNKAAKLILNRPIHSSATDALQTLNWMTLTQRRHYHRCLFIFKCKYGLVNSHLDLMTLFELHRYNTRNSVDFCLPTVKTNWGKHRSAYQLVKDWNNLSSDIKDSSSISSFKTRFLNYIHNT